MIKMGKYSKAVGPLALFALTIWFVLEGRDGYAFFSFFALFGYIFFIVFFRSETLEEGVDYSNGLPVAKDENLPCFTYYGEELNFTDTELTGILTKRFPYFNSLSADDKTIFLKRLIRFIAEKTFRIYDDTVFKEMPVLISAAAIQLTFGLEKYLLPHFRFIHIYPQEFMRTAPVLCLLEGNVSGRAINLSWKHFLEGYAKATDGQNVGLHEMAHALYYQTFIVEENVDTNFRQQYSSFRNDANKAYHAEKNIYGGLYSEYAEKNFQEFWAESIELFFEKPASLNRSYRKLYASLKGLLNQDPLTAINDPLTPR